MIVGTTRWSVSIHTVRPSTRALAFPTVSTTTCDSSDSRTVVAAGVHVTSPPVRSTTLRIGTRALFQAASTTGTTFEFAASIGKLKPFTVIVGLPTVRTTDDTGWYAARAVMDGKPTTSMAVTIRTRQMQR